MALNINWRFAGPQNINVPQSNFLNSLDKNIQNALGIKKEFDKKRDDNEMIRLMTEEAENKLADLINEKDELTTQYNLLTADEQLAQKTNYENKLNELDIQIAAARKEVTDAKMNANQFKTTGTTDFFRWKKDKEYASDVAAINREMLEEQTKNEKLSDLEYEIKSKIAEFNRSNNKDEKIKLNDDFKLLNERYKKLGGENVYMLNYGADIKAVGYINDEINKLTWKEDLINSVDVKEIQAEINKYSDSDDKNKLTQALNNKIDELNKAKTDKDEGANAADKATKDNLQTLYSNKNAKELLTFYNNSKNKNTHKALAKKYLINILREIKPGLSALDNTRALAAKIKYNDEAMNDFIKANADAINEVAR